MGVISITQRSESLGNIHSSGTPRRANTDIGTVQRAHRPVYSPTYFAQHSHGGDAAIGDAIKQASALALAIGQREDERQADKISQAVMSNLDRMDRDDRDIDDWNTPDRKHLEGQKRGLLLRTGEGCRNLPKEADDSYGDTFKKIADSIGATDKQREMAAERLYGYRRARQNRMMDLQASEYRRIELDGAAGQLEQFVTSWKNGNPGVLEDIFKAQERLDVLKGKTEDTRKAERGNLAVVLASDLVRNKLNGCASDEDFDTLEKAVRKGPEEFMPVEIASRLPDGKLGGKTQEALLDEIRREKRVFLAEKERSQREAEREALDKITIMSREARAGGSMTEMEDAIAALDAEAKRQPKGTRIHVAAMEEVARLNAAADAEATRSTWDALVESGGKAAPPAKGSRAAKFYTALKTSYDAQAARWAAGAFAAEDAANREMRRSNEATLRTRMLMAAKLDPGGFSAQIAAAAEKGHISLDQYRKLRYEFTQTWRKEGMPEKAAALVDVMKKEFFAGKDYDLGERLAADPKTGKFGYVKNPDTKQPFEGEDVEFETQMLVPYSPNDWFGFRDFLFPGDRAAHYEKRTQTLTSAEQIQLLDWSLELAQHDGEWISTDPVTGERLDKPRQLNAVQEFQNLCSKMKAGKGVAAAQETVAARAEAQLRLNAAFAAADEGTVAKAAKREAAETNAREAARQTRRAPFAPKMPGSRKGGLQTDGDDYTEN